MAKEIFNNVKRIVICRKTNNMIKIRIVKYGAETWKMNEQTERQTGTLKMKIY